VYNKERKGGLDWSQPIIPQMFEGTNRIAPFKKQQSQSITDYTAEWS